jgi:hypothetical protein
MAATGVLSLVLEFDIDFVMPATGELSTLDHLLDVIALRCTNRRPLGNIESRVDLFLARSGRGYWCAQRRFSVNMGRFYMGFLRAILADFVGPEPIMRFPPLESSFRETDEQAREAEEEARLRIVSAQARGVLVNVENDSDIASEEEPADESDFGSDASDLTDSTIVPYDGDGVESVATPVATEVVSSSSMENNADIADLADLEGCIDDADAA